MRQRFELGVACVAVRRGCKLSAHLFRGVELVSGGGIDNPRFLELEPPLDGVHGGERARGAVPAATRSSLLAACNTSHVRNVAPRSGESVDGREATG